MFYLYKLRYIKNVLYVCQKNKCLFHFYKSVFMVYFTFVNMLIMLFLLFLLINNSLYDDCFLVNR